MGTSTINKKPPFKKQDNKLTKYSNFFSNKTKISPQPLAPRCEKLNLSKWYANDYKETTITVKLHD